MHKLKMQTKRKKLPIILFQEGAQCRSAVRMIMLVVSKSSATSESWEHLSFPSALRVSLSLFPKRGLFGALTLVCPSKM